VPAAKDQRISLAVLEPEHTTNQNSVVANVITMFGPALEYCRIGRQYRNARNTFAALQPVEFVGTSCRELLANILLVYCKDVHREMFSIDECCKGLRVIRYAPKNKRWLQRNGIEAVDRHSDLCTALVDCRYDSNTGCETTHRTPILGQI
jgi:hypothetical protein